MQKKAVEAEMNQESSDETIDQTSVLDSNSGTDAGVEEGLGTQAIENSEKELVFAEEILERELNPFQIEVRFNGDDGKHISTCELFRMLSKGKVW